MKRIVGLICILFLVFFVTSSAVDKLTPFLRDNYSALDIADLDLSLMEEDLDNYDVILSGAEYHGTTATYELQYALTEALHETAGVRYLLLGIGHASAQMFNSYLTSGDPEILNRILSEIRYSSSSCLEHRTAWEKLQEFNQSLPEDDKLTVIGIDLEYQPYTAIYYLNSLTGGQIAVPEPQEYLDTPEALQNYISRLERDFSARQEQYQAALDDKYSDFELVLENLADTVAANIGEDFYAIREEIMYKNFLRAYYSYPAGKYFGQFSMEHIYQHQVGTPNMEGIERLAMFLNRDDSPVQGRVLSMATMYVDSVFRFFYGRYYTADIDHEYFADDLIFKKLSESDYTLFRLTGEDSPFTRNIFTVRNPHGGVTTDYYQYILVIKNSKSTSANKV